MSIETSIPPGTCKEHLESYSIQVRGRGERWEWVWQQAVLQLSPTERGVMVIKSKDKTRASQRKGALSNWKVDTILPGKAKHLSHLHCWSENWENRREIFEEKRNQWRRSEEGDVGPWWGGDSEGEQEEEREGLRYLVSLRTFQHLVSALLTFPRFALGDAQPKIT